MKPVSKIYICNEDGTRFFGEGPYRLLVGDVYKRQVCTSCPQACITPLFFEQ